MHFAISATSYVLLALDLTMWMAPAGILILIVLMLRRSARHLVRRKRDNSPLAKAPRVPHPAATTSIDSPGEVARWEVQMHETARELSAQLDSKMAALQQLIRSASEQQASLEETMRRMSEQRGETVQEIRRTMSNS